jgi:flagellar hook assembly protein FlgD
VKTLLDEETSAGTHSLVWNGKDERGKSVATGIYFSKIKTDTDIQTKKMLLMK